MARTKRQQSSRDPTDTEDYSSDEDHNLRLSDDAIAILRVDADRAMEEATAMATAASRALQHAARMATKALAAERKRAQELRYYEDRANRRRLSEQQAHVPQHYDAVP